MAGFVNTGGLNAPPKSIVNGFSAGSVFIDDNIFGSGYTNYIKKTLSGAVTANVYKSIVSITGSGILNLCLVYTTDASSRTIGLQIIIDGITAFDAVSSTIAGTGRMVMGIGYISGNAGGYIVCGYEPKAFNTSLNISIKQSLSETDKIGLGCNYTT